jgi:hypothetical protein
MLENFFDGISGANGSACEYPAQHTASSAQLSPKSWAHCLQLLARCAHGTHREVRFSHAKFLTRRQAVYVEAFGRDVLADDPGTEAHRVQSLCVHQEHLALSAWARMSAARKAPVAHGARFGKFLHGQAPLASAEQV